MNSSLYCLATIALSTFAGPQVAAPVPSAPSGGIHLEWRVEPFVDAWFHVRALGSARTKPEVPEFLAEAVAAASALDAELGSPLLWGPIEGLLGTCKDAAQARAAFEHLPEAFALRSGAKVNLRTGALKVADALARAEARYRETLWPEHERAIQSALKSLREGFEPKQAACYALHAQSLGISTADLAIPCFLVFDEPAPGAITQRDDDGRGVCFVAVEGAQGSELAEIVLHESTHALDLAGDDDVFDQLRARLAKAGLKPSDRELRDAPHTLMFIQSAETIRRTLAPEHVAYGESSGYYAKVERVSAIERPIWKSYLDGASTRDEALERIVSALLAKDDARAKK